MDEKKRAGIRQISRVTQKFARRFLDKLSARPRDSHPPSAKRGDRWKTHKDIIFFYYELASLTGLYILAIYVIISNSDSSLKLLAAISLWRMGRKIMRHLAK